ncbi:hypothetical protein AB9C39_27665, partial [Klebsiella pneumoniae]|uniref:hypothetical protein n=1 Tax=Klebsiella pneumoniae TaxID=573 RepID=UPI003510C5E4
LYTHKLFCKYPLNELVIPGLPRRSCQAQQSRNCLLCAAGKVYQVSCHSSTATIDLNGSASNTPDINDKNPFNSIN